MSALPVPIADRVAKLLPMLGSNRDGETLSAVRAIGRTLSSAGREWHDLARSLAAETPVRRAEPTGDWRTLARFCLERSTSLPLREQDFLVSLCRWRGCPTERQLDWLRSIYAKLTRRGC